MTTTDMDYTPERAAEVLSPDGGYLWHSGGGLMLARVDLPTDQPADEWPYVLVSTNEDGAAEGWYVGYYPTEDADGTDHVISVDPSDLREQVSVYRARTVGSGSA